MTVRTRLEGMQGLRRRTLLAAGAFTLLGGMSRPGEAATSANPRVLRLALSGPFGMQISRSATDFAAAVSKATNGRLRIDVYSNGALGGERETSEDLQTGALDFAIASSAGYGAPSIVPKLGVFDIPFLFRDLNHARATLDGPIGTEALKSLAGSGVVGLGWAENGMRQISSATKPVRSPADLHGIKIRVPQTDAMVAGFRALGADAQPYSFVDLYAALADGTFEAQENPLGVIRASNFDKVQKYLSVTSHVYSPAMFMVSERIFKSFSAEEQAILQSCAVTSGKVSRAFNDENEKGDLDELRKRGMTVITDIDRGAFAAEMNKARGQFEATFGKDTLAAIENYKG